MGRGSGENRPLQVKVKDLEPRLGRVSEHPSPPSISQDGWSLESAAPVAPMLSLLEEHGGALSLGGVRPRTVTFEKGHGVPRGKVAEGYLRRADLFVPLCPQVSYRRRWPLRNDTVEENSGQ